MFIFAFILHLIGRGFQENVKRGGLEKTYEKARGRVVAILGGVKPSAEYDLGQYQTSMMDLLCKNKLPDKLF